MIEDNPYERPDVNSANPASGSWRRLLVILIFTAGVLFAGAVVMLVLLTPIGRRARPYPPPPEIELQKMDQNPQPTPELQDAVPLSPTHGDGISPAMDSL